MTYIHSSLVALLEPVVAAVREGGDMLKAEFHRPGGPRGHGEHALIDAEVENRLKRRLLAAMPCGWLGEETAGIATSDGDLWIVDPNDGTRDFLSGRRGSAISVALLRNGQPVLGVVYAPLAPDDNGDLISWADGGPLLRNGFEPVRLSSALGLTLALNADAGDYALHNHQTLPGIRTRAIPSPAYRLALAAVGEVDAAASLTAGLAPWDIAGGHALLVGAGKSLSDRHGRPIDYRRAPFDGCVGGGQAAVQAVLAADLRVGRSQQRLTVRPVRHVADAGRLARAQGCLLGQLVGDALGSAVEFESRGQIRSKFPNGVRRLEDGGTWNLIAGQPTDDSELALGLARTLVARGGFDAEAVGQAYVGWRKSGPFDIGGTTAAGIAAIEGRGRARMESQSNGALMRVSPIGILAAGDTELAAALGSQDAALTHPNPVCRAASGAYAAAIAAGIDGGDAHQMAAAAYEHAGTDEGADEVRRRLQLATRERPNDFQHNMGWVLTAFQNAFFFLNSGAPFEDAVVETVSSGGDTDTTAAICGALLGARWGRDAIPLQWRNAVLTCRPVAGEGVHHPRPVTYWPDDALELAEALLVFAPRTPNT
jgi:ADP-ribosyl-[dinitrogen reductase] hydrolase